MNNEFIPVILGIDVGAYSVARTIYEHYKIKSIVIGKYTYWMTKYSKITDVLTIDNMTEEKLINFLIELIYITKYDIDNKNPPSTSLV